MCDCPDDENWDASRALSPGDRGTTTLIYEGENDRLTLTGRDGREYHFVPNEPVAVMNWDLALLMPRCNDLAMVEVLRG